jgi:hypothetical protein
MTRGRRVGLLFVSLGLIAGTAGDERPERTIPRTDGYFVLAGDFHVHAFPGDGGLAPWEFSNEMRRRGLDVIAITNHNQLMAGRIAAAAAVAETPHAPMVIPGQEITTSRFHMIAVGITRRVDWRLSAGDAIRAVQEQGGVAIAAHPVSSSWRPREPDAVRLLDGAEAAHSMARTSRSLGESLVEFYRAAAKQNPGIAAIGSSDFHFGATLGQSRTFLFVRDVSRDGVLDAIREGRTVAFDGGDRLIGDPALVTRLRTTLAGELRMPADNILTRVAVWLTLSGLVVLLSLR